MAELPLPGDPFMAMSDQVITRNSDGSFRQESVRQFMARSPMPQFVTILPPKERGADFMPEADGQIQAGICAVVAMRLMGMSFAAIAEFLQVPLAQIEELIQRPSTQRTFEQLFQGLINTKASTVQGKIAAFADNAVDVVTELMNDREQRGDVRLKAAQDILDRTGTNADQFFSVHNDSNKQDDELRIVLMTEDTNTPQVEVSIKKGR